MAISVVAVAGQLFGLLGAVVAAGSAVAGLLLVISDLTPQVRYRRVAVMLAVLVAAGAVSVWAWRSDVPWVRGGTLTTWSGPVAADGQRVRQETVAVTDFRGARLAGADLAGLDLREATLDGAVARGASFARADLSGVSLRGADLRGADLADACLAGADLAGAQLAGADVSGATITLSAQNLAQVVGTPARPGVRAEGCRS